VAQFKQNAFLEDADAQMVSRVLTCLIVAVPIAVLRLSGAADPQRWDTKLLLIAFVVMILLSFFLSWP
jgi:uncharacterized membrane protein YtjA (UPF0391 family)